MKRVLVHFNVTGISFRWRATTVASGRIPVRERGPAGDRTKRIRREEGKAGAHHGFRRSPGKPDRGSLYPDRQQKPGVVRRQDGINLAWYCSDKKKK